MTSVREGAEQAARGNGYLRKKERLSMREGAEGLRGRGVAEDGQAVL